MPRKKRLQEDLAQNVPFESIQIEAFLSLIRTSDSLLYEANAFFRRYGLTMTQYNVLRILRGAHPEGHPSLEIGRRLIKRVPDVTRLIDRLQGLGYAERVRSDEDRRVVRVRITKKGLALLKSIDRAAADHHNALLGHMSEAKLKKLISLLEDVRSPSAAEQ